MLSLIIQESIGKLYTIVDDAIDDTYCAEKHKNTIKDHIRDDESCCVFYSLTQLFSVRE